MFSFDKIECPPDYSLLDNTALSNVLHSGSVLSSLANYVLKSLNLVNEIRWPGRPLFEQTKVEPFGWKLVGQEFVRCAKDQIGRALPDSIDEIVWLPQEIGISIPALPLRTTIHSTRTPRPTICAKATEGKRKISVLKTYSKKKTKQSKLKFPAQATKLQSYGFRISRTK